MPRDRGPTTPSGRCKMPLQASSPNVVRQPKSSSSKKSQISALNNPRTNNAGREPTAGSQPSANEGLRTSKRKSLETNDKPTKRTKSATVTRSSSSGSRKNTNTTKSNVRSSASQDFFIIEDEENDGDELYIPPSSSVSEPPSSNKTCTSSEDDNAPLVPARATPRNATIVGVNTRPQSECRKRSDIVARSKPIPEIDDLELLKGKLREAFRRQCGFCETPDYDLVHCKLCTKAIASVESIKSIQLLKKMLQISTRLDYLQMEFWLKEKLSVQKTLRVAYTEETYGAVLDMLENRHGSKAMKTSLFP